MSHFSHLHSILFEKFGGLGVTFFTTYWTKSFNIGDHLFTKSPDGEFLMLLLVPFTLVTPCLLCIT